MVDVDIAALTNAMTDMVVNVNEKDLSMFGLKKGTYSAIKHDTYMKFLDYAKDKGQELIPGGSPGNLARNCAALGLKTALLGSVGDDEIGKGYIRDTENRGIIPIISTHPGPSGICYVLVCEDGEKANFARIGVSHFYGYDLKNLGKAKLFHTSGYELYTNREKTIQTIDHAKKNGAKISFDLAAPGMIRNERESLEKLLSKINILFMTEEEAIELAGLPPAKALDEMAKKCDIVVLKKGKDGSEVKSGKEHRLIPIYPIAVINTNGAGDGYAAGFLLGIIRGYPLKGCANLGSYTASQVCRRKESYLPFPNLERTESI